MDAEVAYLICDFVPIEEFDNLASLSRDVFEGVKRYASHKEIVSYVLCDGATCIFAGYKKHIPSQVNGKYYGSARAIIECNGSVLVVETNNIYSVGHGIDFGFSSLKFGNMTWGGYRKIDDVAGGNIKSLYYADHIRCTLHYEANNIYARTGAYRGYTCDQKDLEKKMGDHRMHHKLIKVWNHQ